MTKPQSIEYPYQEYQSIYEVYLPIVNNMHIIILCSLILVIVGTTITSLIEKKKFDAKDIGKKFLKLLHLGAAVLITLAIMGSISYFITAIFKF